MMPLVNMHQYNTGNSIFCSKSCTHYFCMQGGRGKCRCYVLQWTVRFCASTRFGATPRGGGSTGGSLMPKAKPLLTLTLNLSFTPGAPTTGYSYEIRRGVELAFYAHKTKRKIGISSQLHQNIMFQYKCGKTFTRVVVAMPKGQRSGPECIEIARGCQFEGACIAR